ncbi:MAG: hypothetical protein J2P15_06250 [Micromonosporaceae bacterium]|nr:hypothetical protein [Micromonosporaceae bacterium]
MYIDVVDSPQWPVVEERAAAAALRAHALSIAEVAGGPLARWSTVATPAENPDGSFVEGGIWQLTGHARIPLPADRHLRALQRLHDWWAGNGYQVGEVNAFPDRAGGAVQATEARRRLDIIVQSADTAQWLALLAMTRGYAPAPGERPYG